MKNSLFLFSVILLISCGLENEIETPDKTSDFPFQKVNIADDPLLQDWINRTNLSNARTSSVLDTLDLTEAIRYTDSLGNNIYSLYSPESDPHSLKNVWIFENETSVTGRIFQYTLDRDWFASVEVFPGWDRFTGSLEIMDLSGNSMVIVQVEDGVSMDAQSNSQARMDCEYRMDDVVCIPVFYESCSYSVENPSVVHCQMVLDYVRCYIDDNCNSGGTGSIGPIYDGGKPSEGGNNAGPGGDHPDDDPIDCDPGFENINGRCVLECSPGQIRDENDICVACSVGSPGCNQNDVPCEELIQQNENALYSEKLEYLKTLTGLSYESGFGETRDGSMTNLSKNPNGHSVNLPDGLNYIGFMHTHLDERESGYFDNDGNPIMINPIRMFSPDDLHAFLGLVSNAVISETDIAEIYGTMVSTTGTYTIKYNGDPNNIPSFDPVGTLNSFEGFIKKYGKEKGFLTYVNSVLGGGIQLFKIDNNGVIKEKILDSSNKLRSIKCD